MICIFIKKAECVIISTGANAKLLGMDKEKLELGFESFFADAGSWTGSRDLLRFALNPGAEPQTPKPQGNLWSKPRSDPHLRSAYRKIAMTGHPAPTASAAASFARTRIPLVPGGPTSSLLSSQSRAWCMAFGVMPSRSSSSR